MKTMQYEICILFNKIEQHLKIEPYSFWFTILYLTQVIGGK